MRWLITRRHCVDNLSIQIVGAVVVEARRSRGPDRVRFAAIADIHGNLDALEAVLADIAREGITDVVNLGDHVSGPMEAAKTADLLRAQDFVTIRGDQDRRVRAHHDIGS